MRQGCMRFDIPVKTGRSKLIGILVYGIFSTIKNANSTMKVETLHFAHPGGSSRALVTNNREIRLHCSVF